MLEREERRLPAGEVDLLDGLKKRFNSAIDECLCPEAKEAELSLLCFTSECRERCECRFSGFKSPELPVGLPSLFLPKINLASIS